MQNSSNAALQEAFQEALSEQELQECRDNGYDVSTISDEDLKNHYGMTREEYEQCNVAYDEAYGEASEVSENTESADDSQNTLVDTQPKQIKSDTTETSDISSTSTIMNRRLRQIIQHNPVNARSRL